MATSVVRSHSTKWEDATNEERILRSEEDAVHLENFIQEAEHKIFLLENEIEDLREDIEDHPSAVTAMWALVARRKRQHAKGEAVTISGHTEAD